MGEKRSFIKRFFLLLLKQASICPHNVPKDAKIQNLGGIFSSFFYSFKISLKMMILNFQKFNGCNGVPLYFHKSLIFNENAENISQTYAFFHILVSCGDIWRHVLATKAF